MRRFVLLSIFLFSGAALFADALRLTSGQVLEGKIVDESEAVIVFRTHRGVISVDKKDILDIERTGEPKKIARVPKDIPSAVTAALMSFIPFYSGLYVTTEPGLGLPFAAANGYYGLTLLRQLFGSHRYTDWGNTRQSGDVFLLASINNQALSSPGFSPQSVQPTLSTMLLGYSVGPDVFRLLPTQSTKVGSKIYERDAFRQYRRRTFYRYVGASSISGALAFVYLTWFRPPGAAVSSAPASGLRFSSVIVDADPVTGTRFGVALSF